jgi:hypothetical protein
LKTIPVTGPGAGRKKLSASANAVDRKNRLTGRVSCRISGIGGQTEDLHSNSSRSRRRSKTRTAAWIASPSAAKVIAFCFDLSSTIWYEIVMDDMPTDKTVIFFRAARPELRDALKAAAKDDLRSVSTLLEKIVEQWLVAHGYLPKPKETKR